VQADVYRRGGSWGAASGRNGAFPV